MAIRAVKGQVVELITGEGVEIAPEPPVHAQARKNVLVDIRAHSWTTGCTRTGRAGERQHTAAARVSDIGINTPDPAHRPARRQAHDVALRAGKETGSVGEVVVVGQLQADFREPVPK